MMTGSVAIAVERDALKAEIERLRAALREIARVSRDEWEFRDGDPIPKWRLIAADALSSHDEQSKEG